MIQLRKSEICPGTARDNSGNRPGPQKWASAVVVLIKTSPFWPERGGEPIGAIFGESGNGDRISDFGSEIRSWPHTLGLVVGGCLLIWTYQRTMVCYSLIRTHQRRMLGWWLMWNQWRTIGWWLIWTHQGGRLVSG